VGSAAWTESRRISKYEGEMTVFRRALRLLSVAAILAAVRAPSAFPQAPQPQDPASPAAPTDNGAPTPAPKNAKKNADTAATSTPDQPTWDPLRADRDMQVGEYYMHKGDVDAAIDRFQDAILAKPGYGLPFRYLGEAQEKKGFRKPAIKSYQRYLELVPKADDADKVKKKIEKLYKETEKDKNK
jgi:tetratricopeptide (TPR) repeat protein